ncbi:MAG: TonB-dependent receptor [Burkholderiales bacterium]|nr:TonB-dependent receptor [Burkholderiales bacterium]
MVDAKSTFQRAVELDSEDPSTRVGLALALIRVGKKQAGRQELEIAAVVDPANSLVRSYLGKAYFEERTADWTRMAEEQLKLARQLDPLDPTPSLYGALLLSRQNRPVEAVRELARSKQLNDNRAPYRSRLLLDEDIAVRSADLVRSYRDLGYGQVAERESSGIASTDPGNFVGHRLLAESYYERPRHTVAQVSEVLQAQVWQPLNSNPLQIDRIDDGSFILRGTGPSTPGINEYSSLFTKEGPHLQATGMVGTNDTLGHQIVASILKGRVAASIGSFGYRSDGIQDGWGLEKNLTNGFVQIQPTADSSLFVEARSTERVQGDLQGNFFGESRSLRLTEDRQLARAGGRIRLNNAWSVAAVGSYIDGNAATEFPAGTELLRIKGPEHSGEVQGVMRGSAGWLMFGGSHYRADGNATFFGFTSGATSASESVYAYGSLYVIPSILRLDAGLSSDRVKDDALSEVVDQLSPKLGLLLRPVPFLTLRAASFRALRRGAVAEQTIEPTNVTGFNQFYDDSLGASSVRNGVGVDVEVNPTTFVGIETSRRTITIPQLFLNPIEYYTWRERDARGYLYYAPSKRISLAAECFYERISEDPQFYETFLDVITRRVPLSVRMFPFKVPLSIALTSTYVSQEGLFLRNGGFEPGKSTFWTTDIAFTYQLPSRLGTVSLDVRNLFDESFNYQETDILRPTLARERMVFLRASLYF